MNDHPKAPIGFFDQRVLASYRDEPDKWILETDFFEGHLSITDAYYKQLEQEGNQRYLDIRFGYRALRGGDLAVVAWLPDLVEKSSTHLGLWRGFHLQNPEWLTEDERFQLWCRRYLNGDWNVENGPRWRLGETVETIRGLTAICLATPLFSHPIPETLPFPSAQNTHRYQDAHAQLYKYLIDGIDKASLAALARRISAEINVGSSRTVDTLRKLLPGLDDTLSPFARAYSLISEHRRLANHGAARDPARTFPAFEQFTEDLKLCISAAQQLLGALEKVCGMNGESANRRWRRMLQLPKLVQSPDDQYSITQASGMTILEARQMAGKTVSRVEVGFREKIEGVHQSELLIIHFIDGSILSIEAGSNAGDLSRDNPKLNAEDFHVDFILQWVPALSGLNEPHSTS